MAVVYTTAALVRKRIEDIDVTLVDADIDQYIYEAESIIDCIMKKSFVATFDSTKHGILMSMATDIAALACLQYNPAQFPSPHIAEMTATILQDSIRLSYYMLNDPKIVDYLAGL